MPPLPNIPTDPICMWTYLAIFVVSTVLHRTGILDRLLSGIGGAPAPGTPPATPTAHPILGGIAEVAQYLRDHQDLINQLRSVLLPAAPPPPKS